jgi:hypothetical protein
MAGFCRTNCVLGALLGNLALIAWALGIQAGYNVLEYDDQTAFGLLGYHPNNSDAASSDDSYFLKYTVQQEDLFVDFMWRLGRYLYFVLGVVGLLQTQLLCVSFCGAWPILSENRVQQRRTLAWICLVLAVLPIAIAWILYNSALCESPIITLEYVETNGTANPWSGDSDRVIYATTATREESNSTNSTFDDIDGEEENACTPIEGATALWAASALWLFCGLLVVCCTPRQSFDKNDCSSNKLRSPLLTPEPLLDPATRTLGWVAKIIVLTLFATVPYWTQAALVAMAPKDAPFLSSSSSSATAATTDTIFPHTQLLGPTIFNPTQDIAYSTEQREWIDPAFEQANMLAWVPFAVNLCLALPLVLYGRHRLSQKSASAYRARYHCWPYLIFLLTLIQFCSAAMCVWIPLSAVMELCPRDAKRYPELLYVDLGDGIWQGTDIVPHSAMKANCWPTEVGQILAIGGTLLSLVQAGLLLCFSLQYSNARDTLATFAGIEEDQLKLLGKEDDDGSSNEENAFV